jgi:DNA-binding NtrC family response regulator
MSVTKTVLVVDDNAHFAEGLSRWLELLGYRSLLCGTGEEALVALQIEPIDALLLDLRLPGIQGHTLLRSLWRSKRLLPTVVMSGHGSVSDVITAFRNRAVDFLQKPFRMEELSAALDRALEPRQALPARATEENHALAEQIPDGEGPSPAQTTVLLVDDGARYRQTLASALQGEHVHVEQAPSGLHALQILEARPVDLIVTEQALPGMEGLELLITVRRRWPTTSRLLLTEYPRADLLINAVNQARIVKALSKRLSTNNVVAEIRQVIYERRAAEGVDVDLLAAAAV